MSEAEDESRTIVVSGPDPHDLSGELSTHLQDVRFIDDVLSRDSLSSIGIAEADTFVLTDLEQATAIPIAHDINRDVRLVIFARGRVPDFVRAQLDIAIDPRAVTVEVVAEELSHSSDLST